MRSLILCALAGLIISCDTPTDSNDPGDSVASTLTFTFNDESFSLDASAVRGTAIQVNGMPSSTHNASILILLDGNAPDSYDETNAGIQFTNSDGTMHTVDDNAEEHGAAATIEITQISPRLQGTFTATVVQSFDPDFTTREITAGSFDIGGTDYVNQ